MSAVKSEARSPLGYFYSYNQFAPLAFRLARGPTEDGPWEIGKPEFSLQAMSPEELRHIADLIDLSPPPDVG